MNKSNPQFTVNISDGELSIWLDKCDEVFLKKVTLSVCAKLRRFGWAIRTPYGEIDTCSSYGKTFNKKWTERFRKGEHSGLEFESYISGRCLTFSFWEDVIDHKADNSNGGRYIFNKESKMPYLLRIRTHLVRMQILKHLTKHYDVLIGKNSMEFPRKRKLAFDLVQKRIKTSGHYVAELGHARITDSYHKSADGVTIEHGMPVYALDYRGRFIKGVAYYDLNMNWNVITGKYDYSCISNSSIYVKKPDNLRVKQNTYIRRRELEKTMSRAVKCMDFDKAKAVKAQLFGDEPLYHVIKDGLYYGSNGSGYTSDTIDAGKYTESEVKYYRTQSYLTVKPIFQEAA